MVEREIIVKNGIFLRKYFLDVSQDEQRRRFAARIDDPLEHWKLSPMDTKSVRRWWGLRGGLSTSDQGHPHARGALVHRPRRQ